MNELDSTEFSEQVKNEEDEHTPVTETRHKGRVLVVDDDVQLLAALRSGLSLNGYQCEIATRATYALELIREFSFDVMVTDIVMPDMKGLDLTEKVKKVKPDMVVIIMTGFIDDFSYDDAMESGASDFIKKPFTLKELISRIEHARLHQKLQTLALHDELTGLYNRRGFFALAEQLLKLAKRQQKGLFMLYADFDDLKRINDTLGHQKGDLALIHIAGILKVNFRDSDIIARIGGDEFVVMPIGTTGDNVDIIIDRLQRAIQEYNLKTDFGFKLSLSTGIAYFNPLAPSPVDVLLSQADKSMYEHKRAK
ncbi:MAG: diguanylate cyclase [Nitrospirota bacterium]